MVTKFNPLLLICLLLLMSPTQAKRVALVIGNDSYQHVAKLQKARNDASAMAISLRAAGFEVVEHKDLKHRGMVRAIQALSSSIAGGDEVVVFFAGHGVQLRGGGYLLPIDIEAESEAEVERTAISLEDLTHTVSQAKPGFSLIIVDACRDNPLQSKNDRGRTIGATRGLNPVEAPKGQIVVYSAGRGQQALDRLSDGDINPNSVFTREFIARMNRPGVRIQDLVEEVGESVEKLARTVNHEQSPAIYNQARGSFFFYGPKAVNGPSTSQASPTYGTEQRDEKFWQEAKSLGTKLGFEAYLKTYPKGRYAALAEGYVQKLSTGPPSTTVEKSALTPTPSVHVLAEQLQFPVPRFQPVVGDSWTYEAKDHLIPGQRSSFVTRRVTEKRQDNLGFLRETTKDGQKVIYWTNSDLNPAYDADGLPRYQAILKWPLIKGNTWPSERIIKRTGPDARVVNWDLQCEAKGIEAVTVAAGSFNAVKVSCIGAFAAKSQTKQWGGTLEETFWWSPIVRYYVKYQFRDRNSSGELVSSLTHELTHFALK
jgi:Caspase domain